MNDELTQLIGQRRPTPERPLLGLTVLLVEDSRFASEALRLICQTSGARLRRADTLASARRHLALYRPTAVIVDMGLPDGSGADLIAELDQSSPRVPVLIGISGASEMRTAALRAGAQSFLEKPVNNITVVQHAILSALPEMDAPRGPRRLDDGSVTPDEVALRDDLTRLEDMLRDPCSRQETSYAAQFLSSLAHSSGDPELADAARALDAIVNPNAGVSAATLRRVTETLRTRISETSLL